MKLLTTLLFISNFCWSQKTILWEVIDSQSGTKSFILGTFHNIGNSFVDSISVISETLEKSEIAIFESIDDGSKLTTTLQKRNKQKQINSHLSKADLSKLKVLSNDWKINYQLLKPIELLITLKREFQLTKCKTVKPNDKWDHMDNYLIDIAKKHKINLVGLETDSIQLNILVEMEKSWTIKPIAQDISYWISKLTSEQEWYKECDETQNYINFEIEYEFSYDCQDDILIKKRNEEWIPTIVNLFSQKSCFLAVGLLHLKYKCGILEVLKSEGFIVNPIIITSTNQ